MSIGYSNLFDSSGNPKEIRWEPGQVITVVGRWDMDAALTSATNTTNTYYKAQLVPIPADAQITDWRCSVTNLDTGGNTLTFNIGDGNDGTRFASALTIGQTGASNRNADASNGVTITTSSGRINKGLGYRYGAYDTIDFQVQTAPGTSATTGVIQLIVEYYCGPSYY